MLLASQRSGRSTRPSTPDFPARPLLPCQRSERALPMLLADTLRCSCAPSGPPTPEAILRSESKPVEMPSLRPVPLPPTPVAPGSAP
jgi:hypothetical protein